ncbi:hypothetical protein [Pseudocolwellia sp. HL-MZ7]|uniref:hypothetical protein n=1 Tax=Pseudocolwellia sp. HL-MZ7 TaxID=3400627 RepID=UPI003CF40091
MNSRTESSVGLASDNDLRIALHYEDAAKILYNSNAYQDEIVLPTLFLIRQYLELILKHNINKLNEISSCNNLINKLNTAHRLVKIHEAFIEHYENVKSIKNITDTGDESHLNNLKNLITEISKFDSDSQGFRYSKNKRGEKIIGREELFNLKNTFCLLDKVSDFLNSIEEM